MPSDAWSPSPAQPPQSLEALKQIFKQRLELILNKQLTVDNIETFADEALTEIIQLTEDILTEYKKNSDSQREPVLLSPKEQEDHAFAFFELQNISGILERVGEVKENISKLKDYLKTQVESIDTVITPPQEGHRIETNGVGVESFDKKMFPRLLTLVYILERDFGIPPVDVKITKGAVTSEMVRQTPYVRVEVLDLSRVVYICDEEGNASYVFDTDKLVENSLTIENIDLEDKGEKNTLINSHPGIGVKIIQTKNWRSRMAKVLGGPITIPSPETGEKDAIASEFRERKKYLLFNDFQRQARALYPGTGNIQGWYKEERRNHPNWPANPNRMYKNNGWLGWPELVEKENRLKKEWSPFLLFQKEIKDLYPGFGDMQRWYKEERRNHPNWPAAPDQKYKNSGWLGWPELVGKENHLKKDWLTFTEFQQEVRMLYPGHGTISGWYKEERKKHSNWPDDPQKLYGNYGWLGWPELVGRDNLFKKEWLSIEEFKQEVRALYPGKGNIVRWYKEERRNHPNWPAAPEQKYKDNGWLGWSELVGMGNNPKKA